MGAFLSVGNAHFSINENSFIEPGFYSVALLFGYWASKCNSLRSKDQKINMNFVAAIPEQVGTTTMHFSEVSGFAY